MTNSSLGTGGTGASTATRTAVSRWNHPPSDSTQAVSRPGCMSVTPPAPGVRPAPAGS
ncbi:hypothetical protein ACFFX0_22330 [Citricoccus parietis]|uniref:Uncharacterized protein n=1 Tax=Citricoccus parietis TaxID=592307 RepID=A0ABV5G4E5_9MICC